MNNEQIPQELENFINRNRKICWEAEFEQGEFCIGENKVIDFFNQYLSQSSQPKGAEESWEEMRKALNCMEGSDWDIFCMKNNIYAAMQSFASQQCAEKDKEIAELKKSQQPEVSEDRNPFAELLKTCSPEELLAFQGTKITRSEPQPVQGESDGWVRVGDRLPTEEDADENGKVLLYRDMNDSQKSLSKSIHDYFMVKNCDKDSFWRPLPSPPKANK
jgi:hypothetical protein